MKFAENAGAAAHNYTWQIYQNYNIMVSQKLTPNYI